jgi:NAD kinase
MEPDLAVLMVGRIFEEDLVFKLIEKAIGIILSLSPVLLYFTDARTKDKILEKRPKAAAFEFIPSQHHSLINYIITIGGDGTILYAAKEFKTKVPPIITFQRGSLGFMCRFSLH